MRTLLILYSSVYGCACMERADRAALALLWFLGVLARRAGRMARGNFYISRCDLMTAVQCALERRASLTVHGTRRRATLARS